MTFNVSDILFNRCETLYSIYNSVTRYMLSFVFLTKPFYVGLLLETRNYKNNAFDQILRFRCAHNTVSFDELLLPLCISCLTSCRVFLDAQQRWS